MVEKTEKPYNTIKSFFLEENPSLVNDNKKILLYLIIPLLVSLTVKLILITALFNSSINSDGILYITAAQHYANGEFAKGLALYPMPFYPLLLAFVHLLIPDWILSGYVISITSMILATIPLYYITKTLFGVKPAFWACMLFAFLPEFNEWSLYISRDSLFLFIFGSSVYFGLQSLKKKNLLLFVLTFIFVWIAILIRIEGILFIPFYFIALIFFAITNNKLRHVLLLRAVLWVGIPLCSVIVVFLIAGTHGITVNRFDQVFLKIATLFNGNFVNNYHRIYTFLAEAENNAPFSGMKCNIAALARHYMLILYLIGIIEVIGKIIFPLSYIPMFIGLKNKLTSSRIFMLFLGFVYILLILYLLITKDFISTRFLMIPAFMLLPWIGFGLIKVSMKLNTSVYRKTILVFLSIIIIAPAIKTFKMISHKDNSISLTAQWLSKNIKKKEIKIVTNSKKAAFYIKLKNGNTLNWKILKKKENIKPLEKIALKINADLMVFKIKNKDIQHIPPLKFYRIIKSIKSYKYTTIIYTKIIQE